MKYQKTLSVFVLKNRPKVLKQSTKTVQLRFKNPLDCILLRKRTSIDLMLDSRTFKFQQYLKNNTKTAE